MNATKLALSCLTALSLSSCKQVDMKNFPSKGVYEVVLVNNQVKCSYYQIIKENPLTFAKGYTVACPPSIFGFHYKEVPYVIDWIRSKQAPNQLQHTQQTN